MRLIMALRLLDIDIRSKLHPTSAVHLHSYFYESVGTAGCDHRLKVWLHRV